MIKKANRKFKTSFDKGHFFTVVCPHRTIDIRHFATLIKIDQVYPVHDVIKVDERYKREETFSTFQAEIDYRERIVELERVSTQMIHHIESHVRREINTVSKLEYSTDEEFERHVNNMAISQRGECGASEYLLEIPNRPGTFMFVDPKDWYLFWKWDKGTIMERSAAIVCVNKNRSCSPFQLIKSK